MTSDDLLKVASIEKQSTAFPWSLKHFQDCLKAGHQAWVMCDSDQQIVCFTVVQKVVDELHLLNICVQRQQQGQGFGKTMLNHVIQHAKQLGSVLIVLEVRRSNAKAQSLYNKAGFNEMSVRRDYYPAKQGREDAILMGLDLDLLSLFGASS
ncbi:MAG: ribosomal protein S18-alanine N-acetyltransferase [Piscirickettsiaceae bacterium]|jgi:[ribosomal protein S18]-alanine N-acetyltransferase|nr:ribosomal protein S18-alanine N-acetyltransferase [Piscirickettsiaceae bacterium]